MAGIFSFTHLTTGRISLFENKLSHTQCACPATNSGQTTLETLGENVECLTAKETGLFFGGGQRQK